jgi:hypothetical protein
MRREYVEQAPDVLALASDATLRYVPDAALGYEIQVDWDRAGRDRTLVNAVRRVMGDQLAFHERRRIVLEQALAMCALLGEALGRTCEPPGFRDPPVVEDAPE